MNASEVIGKRVLDRNANELGKVGDIDIDTSTWAVAHLVVHMGVFKKVTVAVGKIDKVGDEIFLKVSKDELR